MGQPPARRPRRRPGTHRARTSCAATLGVGPAGGHSSIVMGPYATLFILLALLAGLIVGKAWERYKLKDGRWIDRRRARESPHYMLGLNFLVANQIDQAIEELSAAARSRRRSARDSPHSRQPLSREGAGRTRDPGTPEPAATPEPSQSRARERPALPWTRLSTRRVRGPGIRSVLGSAQAGPAQPICAGESREAVRGTAPVDGRIRDAAEARGARRRPTSSRRHSEILAFLENEIGLAALKRTDYPKRRDGSKRQSSSIREHAPATSISGTSASPRATRRGDRRLGTAGRNLTGAGIPRHSHGSEHAYSQLGEPRASRRSVGGLIAANPQEWRARLALARHLTSTGKPAEALALLFEALVINPARARAAPGNLGDAVAAETASQRWSTDTSS